MTFISMPDAERIAQAMELPDAWLEGLAKVSQTCLSPLGRLVEDAVATLAPAAFEAVNSWVAANTHKFGKRLPYLNPWHMMASMVAYFVIIALLYSMGRCIGKQTCRGLGIVHNFVLHLVSLYMCVGLGVSARAAGYSLWNNPAGESAAEWRIAKLIWLFYFTKVWEWMDTFIMLLKQNYHQVSFLHVYHHTTIFAIWWLAALAAPGGEAYYSAMVNSGVHVVMYGYYFLTLLFPKGKVRDFLNNFKFVITQGQMTQFAFNCLQSVYDLVLVPRAQLKYSANLLQLLFWYMISLLALFGNFLFKGKKTHRERSRSAGKPDSNGEKGTSNGHVNGNAKAHPASGHSIKNGH